MADNYTFHDSNETHLNQQELSDIHIVVAETLKEFMKNDREAPRPLKITRPTTLQGWLAVIFSFATILAFTFTGIAFLNRIADHHKQATHDGARELIEEMRHDGMIHESDETSHISPASLKLEIQEQTKPLADELDHVREGVIEIKTKVDILLDRQMSNEHNRRSDVRDR